MLSRGQLDSAKCCNDISHICRVCELRQLKKSTNGTNCVTEAAKTALDLLDKTEAQQKEIEKIMYLYDREISEHAETFQNLSVVEKEVEQLKAQNVAMRLALDSAKQVLIYSNANICSCCCGIAGQHDKDCVVKITIGTIDMAIGGGQ